VGSRLEDDTQSLWENVLNFKSNHNIIFFCVFFYQRWNNIWRKLWERGYLSICMHYVVQSRNRQGCIHQVLLQLLNRNAYCLSAGRCSLLKQVWWDLLFPSPSSGKNYFSPRGFWEDSGVDVGVIEHLAHTESLSCTTSWLLWSHCLPCPITLSHVLR